MSAAPDLSASILQALRRQGGALSSAELQTALGVSQPTVSRALTPLIQAGEVQKVGAARKQRYVLPRTVREWAITGEPFSAQEAQLAGLVNHIVPAAELDAKVQWLVDRIADKSPTAIRRGKAAMRAIASMSFDEAIAHTEAQIGLLTLTEDAKEGLAAFNDKRRPAWTGR